MSTWSRSAAALATYAVSGSERDDRVSCHSTDLARSDFEHRYDGKTGPVV